MNLNTALSLLGYLRANEMVRVCQVARAFSISEKEVQKYIAYLGELSVFEGYDRFERCVDIDVQDDDPNHLWISTRDTLGINAPLRFTNAQAVAIMGGLKFLESQPHIADRDAVSALIEKLGSGFSDVDPGIQIDIEPANPETISILKSAITNDTCVSIEYGSITDQSVSSRLIEPLVLLVNENAVTVRAYCHESEAIRSFRVDRILRITGSDRPATTAKNPDDGSAMDSAQLSIKLLMDVELLEEFAPQTILDSQVLGDKVEAHIRVSAFSWIASLVLTSGGAIKVLEPPQLREIVLEKAERWAQLNGQ